MQAPPRRATMSLLLYCVTGPSTSLPPVAGVSGSPVARFEHPDLAVFYSENTNPDRWLRVPLRTAAEQVHRVQQALFRSAAIIPFRFPAILEDQEKLRDHLTQRSSQYKSLLDRFATFVQMDITLTGSAAPADRSSGARYLRDRQSRTHSLEQFASETRAHVNQLATDWRQRSIPNGLRCFALVERERVHDFNETMKSASVPAELTVRISGPWPVAEFLEFST